MYADMYDSIYVYVCVCLYMDILIYTHLKKLKLSKGAKFFSSVVFC